MSTPDTIRRLRELADAAMVAAMKDGRYPNAKNNEAMGIARQDLLTEIDRLATTPIDMVLHCPACGKQHIDAPEEHWNREFLYSWENPPHRSHLCHGCGHIWRPADVPTNGVAAVQTEGKADSPIVAPALR